MFATHILFWGFEKLSFVRTRKQCAGEVPISLRLLCQLLIMCMVYDIITYIFPPGMRLECTASIGQVYWHTTTETCQVVIMMTLKMIMVVVILLNIDDDNGHDDDDSNGHGYVICLWWRWQDVANRCQQSQRSMRAGSQEELLKRTLIGKTESAFHNIGKLP